MSKWWLVALLLLSCAMNAQAQNCPAGIPSGGNPHCIPPDRPESPYYNGSGAYVQQPAQPKPQPIVMQQKWSDRWGSIVTDEMQPIIGTSTGEKNKSLAEKQAVIDCKNKGGTKCSVVLTYRNQCGVMLAKRGGGVITARGPTINAAVDYGKGLCKKDQAECEVYYTNCSMSEEYWVKQ